MRSISPALVLAILLALPVAGEDAARPRFVDRTADAGIRFRNSCGSREKDWIVEVNGAGAALFDYDGDGDLDIYLVNGSVLDPPAGGEGAARPRDALYRNDGGWRFADVTEAAGLGDEGWGGGAAVADIDNDGLLDLYVANRGPNVLYRNRGGGAFEKLESSGAEDPRWSSAASLADFDGDGLVDIYVANYIDFDFAAAKPRASGACRYKDAPIFCGPGGLKPAPDSLFINRGGGRFRDASDEWGVRAAPPSYGLGTLVVDVQGDGRPDVVVANDTMANFCFLNDGGRRFREAGLYLGLAYNDHGVAQAGMGLASGDTRGLGLDDILVTNFEDDTNTLHLAEPDGRFYADGTYAAGLGGPSYPYLSWGCFFFDADGDGDLDLFVANGHLAPQMDSVRSSIGYRQRNQLFLNDGRGRFAECADCGPGLEVLKSSRGAAFGDLDGDGDPDIVINDIDDEPTILENRSPPARWAVLRLRGGPSNAAAIGARVEITAGGRRQVRTVQSGMSYASQCELDPRFGLGSADAVEKVRVIWPSGRVEEFPGFPLGEKPAAAALVEGRGREVKR